MVEQRSTETVFPEDWEDVGESLMSNFDREVDETVAAKLKEGPYVADYPGWDFHAVCWFKDGLYHARVKCYQVVRGFYSAATPAELMEVISEEYGYG